MASSFDKLLKESKAVPPIFSCDMASALASNPWNRTDLIKKDTTENKDNTEFGKVFKEAIAKIKSGEAKGKVVVIDTVPSDFAMLPVEDYSGRMVRPDDETLKDVARQNLANLAQKIKEDKRPLERIVISDGQGSLR